MSGWCDKWGSFKEYGNNKKARIWNLKVPTEFSRIHNKEKRLKKYDTYKEYWRERQKETASNIRNKRLYMSAEKWSGIYLKI